MYICNSSCLQRCKQVVSCKLHVQTMCHRLVHMHAPAAWIHNDYACHPLLHGSAMAHHAMNASMYDIACSTGGKKHSLDPLRESQGASTAASGAVLVQPWHKSVRTAIIRAPMMQVDHSD